MHPVLSRRRSSTLRPGTGTVHGKIAKQETTIRKIRQQKDREAWAMQKDPAELPDSTQHDEKDRNNGYKQLYCS